MKKLYFVLLLGLFTLQLTAQSLQDRYRAHIETLSSDDFQGRGAATRGDTLAIRYIQEELSKIEGLILLGDNGIQTADYRTRISRADTTRISRTTFNVVAFVEAGNKRYRDRTVILGAHYDHLGMREVDGEVSIYNGADDNASGVAFLIESAREFVARKNELKANVILIFFGGEERGLIGSRFYANNPLRPLEEVKLMLNFDMLGRMNRGGMTIRGLGTSKEAFALFGSLKNPDKLDLIFEMRGNGPTDYSSFYAKGIPAFSYSTRQHADYHKPTDTMDKINYEGMEMARDYIWQVVEKTVFGTMEFTFKDVMD